MKELFFDDDELVLDDPNIYIEEDGTYKLEPGDPGYVPPNDVPIPEPIRRRSKKVAHTYTEVVGIINNVLAHLKNAENAAILNANGFAVAARITRLETKLAELTEANAEQERRKVKVQQQTEIVEGLLAAHYPDASGAVDAIADAYGKGSDAAKNALKMRQVRRGPNEDEPPTPPAP